MNTTHELYKIWVKKNFWGDRFMPELQRFGSWNIYIFDILADRSQVFAGSKHRTTRWYKVRETTKGKYILYKQKRLYFTKWEENGL